MKLKWKSYKQTENQVEDEMDKNNNFTPSFPASFEFNRIRPSDNVGTRANNFNKSQDVPQANYKEILQET